MSVTVSGGLGISPVLLQAVSSLASIESGLELKARDLQQQSVMEKQQTDSKVVSHLLQGIHEPMPFKSSPNTASNSEKSVKIETKPDQVSLNVAIQERLASQLAMKQGRIVEVPSPASTISSDVSMVNLLTALATHHAKAKQDIPSQEMLTSSGSAAGSVTMQQSSNGTQGEPQQQIIIYYNNEQGQVTPSTPGSMVVRDLQEEKVEGALQNYHVVLHHDNSSNITVTTLPEPRASLQVLAEAPVAVAGSSIVPENAETLVDADISVAGAVSSTCPVCADKISGYHYGAYTCESCKGFFKRTVQNKKSFTCLKQGDCEVTIHNRKKCPACRYTKCIAVGMRLEAIRPDRTRGGRSTYSGSPYLKPKALLSLQKTKPVRTDQLKGDKVWTNDAFTPPTVDKGKNHGQLAAILNHSNGHGQQLPEGQSVPVPELLMDILNLEALLTDEDIPLEGATENGIEQQAFYNNLMQLTELRLYNLVRWARNLPQFGAISTDDQILLLQNCWSDLLALCVCWKSVPSPGVLTISSSLSISLEQAQALGFGDVVERLLSITESLQRLQVDHYEFVALKVLLLISADVKGLKESSKIQEYQEKLSDALLEYTSTRYRRVPSKFGEMLLRLPELARISFLAREILLVSLPPSLNSCGLLIELLKGENAVKD